ncbi:MAG: FAD-binding oxidoreductase [Fimbriimonadaceae bacterium]
MARGGLVEATSLVELSAILKRSGPFWLFGSQTRVSPADGAELVKVGVTGFTHLSPADLVCVVGAGTPISWLNQELENSGLTVGCRTDGGTVGGAVSTDGNWRRWVLGMTIVRADGSIARCGSRVVKSVAGYDAHKLFIGSRGAFGAIAEVALRLTTVKSELNPASRDAELNATEQMLYQRAKDIFDPTRKLNPGALGLV